MYYLEYSSITMITTVTQKGQATIPVHIREKLGIQPGEKVIFQERGDEVYIRRIPNFLNFKGSLKTLKKYNKQKASEAVGKMLAQRLKK